MAYIYQNGAWAAANPPIYRKSYNLFDGTSYNAGISSTPPCYYPAAVGGNRTSIFIEVEPSTTYTISLGEVVDRITIVGYFNTFDPSNYTIENQKAADEIINSLVTNVQQATFTTGSQTVFVGILCGLNTLATDIMFNLGSTALPYEAYDTALKWYATADHMRTSGAWS